MHHFLHRSDMIKILHIVPAEDQTIFYVTFYGTDQSLGDAIRSLGGITFFQTTEAVGDVLLLLCNFFKKGIVNRPARHTYRTCNDLNVFFLAFT